MTPRVAAARLSLAWHVSNMLPAFTGCKGACLCPTYGATIESAIAHGPESIAVLAAILDKRSRTPGADVKVSRRIHSLGAALQGLAEVV